MTKLNLKDKIVFELRLVDKPATEVWLTETALEDLSRFARSNDGRRFIKKLSWWSEKGFESFTGKENVPIRYEGDGVYRIGIRASLFRMIGFFDDRSFIVIDSFTKSGQGLSSAERTRIAQVAKIKALRLWRKGAAK